MVCSSKVGLQIKQRDIPNDVFITPLELAKKHIGMIEYNEDDIWYDPFKNDGSYYNQYPNDNKKWTEILEDRDFFDFDENVNIIVSNCPYSMIDRILWKSVSLKPKIISYLIGVGNLTPKRMEFMEKNGYSITKLHICKVFKFYGMSMIVVWELNKSSILSYDRIVWREHQSTSSTS